MTRQKTLRLLTIVIAFIVSAIGAEANRIIADAGAPNEVSAFSVNAGKRTIAQNANAATIAATNAATAAAPRDTAHRDTVKSFDQMAEELQREMSKNGGETVSDPDTFLYVPPVDSAAVRQKADSLLNAPVGGKQKQAKFVPDPAKALWLAIVFPGAGQIYNRKFWKLPIFYGGFLGCAYALTWNQMMYRDYSQAYLDIMDDDPDTKSYEEMLPPRYDITGREDTFKNMFKRKKNFYRRYRDLSAFCFVGVYLLSVIDAYVDAQLSQFDISPDLSMRVKPAVIGTPSLLGSNARAASYGVGCSLNF